MMSLFNVKGMLKLWRKKKQRSSLLTIKDSEEEVEVIPSSTFTIKSTTSSFMRRTSNNADANIQTNSQQQQDMKIKQQSNREIITNTNDDKTGSLNQSKVQFIASLHKNQKRIYNIAKYLVDKATMTSTTINDENKINKSNGVHESDHMKMLKQEYMIYGRDVFDKHGVPTVNRFKFNEFHDDLTLQLTIYLLDVARDIEVRMMEENDIVGRETGVGVSCVIAAAVFIDRLPEGILNTENIFAIAGVATTVAVKVLFDEHPSTKRLAIIFGAKDIVSYAKVETKFCVLCNFNLALHSCIMIDSLNRFSDNVHEQ